MSLALLCIFSLLFSCSAKKCLNESSFGKSESEAAAAPSQQSDPVGKSDSILPLDCLWLKRHRTNLTYLPGWSYSDTEQYFVQGCSGGDLSKVKAMIDKWGQRIVDMGSIQDSWTCLVKAAWNGNQDIAKYLVEERGANVNMGTFHELRAIQAAAYHGNPDMIWYLVSKGAKVNTLDNIQMGDDDQCKPSSASGTPLDEAIHNNQKAAADYLISIGGKSYCFVTEGCVRYKSSKGLGWEYAPNR